MCSLCDVVAQCQSGTHPWQLASFAETCIILGENQGCPGWCVAVLKEHVEHMDVMPIERQSQVFAEVATVARAVRTVFPASGVGEQGRGGPPRINYECLGNVVAHVHWHVVPRHAGDPTPKAPVWGWTPDALRGTMSDADRRGLAERLRVALAETRP